MNELVLIIGSLFIPSASWLVRLYDSYSSPSAEELAEAKDIDIVHANKIVRRRQVKKAVLPVLVGIIIILSGIFWDQTVEIFSSLESDIRRIVKSY